MSPRWALSRAFRVVSLVSLILVAGGSLPIQAATDAQISEASTNLVQDGSFEPPVVPPTFIEYNAGQTFGRWTVSAGSIDL